MDTSENKTSVARSEAFLWRAPTESESAYVLDAQRKCHDNRILYPITMGVVLLIFALVTIGIIHGAEADRIIRQETGRRPSFDAWNNYTYERIYEEADKKAAREAAAKEKANRETLEEFTRYYAIAVAVIGGITFLVAMRHQRCYEKYREGAYLVGMCTVVDKDADTEFELSAMRRWTHYYLDVRLAGSRSCRVRVTKSAFKDARAGGTYLISHLTDDEDPYHIDAIYVGDDDSVLSSSEIPV